MVGKGKMMILGYTFFDGRNAGLFGFYRAADGIYYHTSGRLKLLADGKPGEPFSLCLLWLDRATRSGNSGKWELWAPEDAARYTDLRLLITRDFMRICAEYIDKSLAVQEVVCGAKRRLPAVVRVDAAGRGVV